MQLKRGDFFKMKLTIIEEKGNALFNRKEIKGIAESEVTPSRKEVIKVLAEKFKIPEENIKIKGIHGKFGSKKFNVEANIYSSKEEKDLIELKKKKEKLAEQPLLEKPVEEKKPAETEDKVTDNNESQEDISHQDVELKSDEKPNESDEDRITVGFNAVAKMTRKG